MDTILDKYGKEVQVTGVWFPANIWVMSSSSDDSPVACIAVDVDSGLIVEWEEREGILKELRNYKDKEGYRVVNYQADFSASMTDSGKVVMCSALKDGEMCGRWTNPDFRGSITALAWSYCFWAHTLETKHKDIDKVFGLVSVNNIASNKYHKSIGAKNTGVVKVKGEDFDRYEIEVSDIIEQADKMKTIWEEKVLVNVG